MPGKLQPNTLRKSVLNFTGAWRDDVLTGPGLGEDAALIRVTDGILVAASDPVTGAVKNAGKLLVNVNANDLACKGADPAWLLVSLIVPDELGEDFIRSIMREIHDTCKALNVAIVGGHTEFSDKYSSPVISGTMLGMTRYELTTQNIRPGDLVLVTGHVGLEGMSIIANDREDLLQDLFTQDELAIIKSWGEELSVLSAARTLRHYAKYMHDPTEGGLNGALCEILDACDLELELDDDAIPVNDFTRRAAGKLGFDPRNLISSGMLLAVVSPDQVQVAQESLRVKNIDSQVIGSFIKARARSGTGRADLNTHESLWEILSRVAL